MTTLKSALRFPPAHPPPPPPPPEPQYPNLTSRFSAETLLIKSAPRPFQRLFSSNTSSASSPPLSPPSGTVKRYHRRVSSQKGGVYRHAPSASESRLVVSSPKAYDLPETPTRASMDDVRPPPRSGSISRARATSGTAADKLAGAAKEVLDKFTLRRHGRQGSHSSSASGESRESLASSRPRSLSSPSPAPAPATRPPAPKRRPPPRPLNPPATLVDPPPRSDSRNALTNDLASVSSGGASRAAPLPALASNRPRPKQLPLHARQYLRPTSPPSPSIPPLRPARRPAPKTAEPAKPFQALLVAPPTRAAVVRRSLDELLVRIDVGGQSTYTTSAATLLGDGADAGRLGEFVEAVYEDAKRGGASVDEEQSTQGEQAATHPYLQLPGALTDASSSSCSLAPSLAPSPYPSSPFPFADDLSTYSGCVPGDDEPTSPIDPLVNGSLAATDLFPFSPPPHPLPTQAHAQHGQLVASPTLPHGGKHRSVYPDVGSSVDLGPEGGPFLPFVVPSAAQAPSLAEEAARKALAMRLRRGPEASKRESSGEGDEVRFDSPFERGLGPYFDVVRNQLHTSTCGDSLLVPHSPAGTFSSSSSPILASSPSPLTAVERRSLDFGLPSDIEGYGSEEEHRSRSTVLGVPRGMSRRTLEGLSGLPGGGGDDEVPAVPKLELDAPGTRSRTGTPSLSMSVTTVDDDEDHGEATAAGAPTPTLDDATLTLFLDRTDSPLLGLSDGTAGRGDAAPAAPLAAGMTLYGAVLHFLRVGSLPASLVLPSASTSSSTPSTVPGLATADVEPLYLSLFALSTTPLFALLAALRMLADEAAWLGLRELEGACTTERERVGAVVRWLAQARGSGGAPTATKVKGPGARAKEGWI